MKLTEPTWREEILSLAKYGKSLAEGPNPDPVRIALVFDWIAGATESMRYQPRTPDRGMTREVAEAVKDELRRGKLPQRQIAEKHGIQQSAVSIIKRALLQ